MSNLEVRQMKNQIADEIYQEYYDGYLYVAQSNTSYENEKVFYRLGMLVEIWDEIRRCLHANRHTDEGYIN